MRRHLSIVTALAVAAALASPAFAQAMSHLPRRLTGGDMAILRAEAAKLGPDGPKEEGWRNPRTGHSGVVTYLSASTRQGLPCRTFRYTFHTGTPQDGRPYVLTWCRSQDGNWAIAP